MSERPKKTTRAELLKRIQAHARKRDKFMSVEQVVDLVLAEADAFARPYLENDWSGGEVLHQLRLWRKGRL